MLRDKIKEMYLENGFNKNVIKNPENYSGPFLIDVDESYVSAKNKIMIFGQETYGWKNFSEYKNESNCIEEYIQHYKEFNNGLGYYVTPFWYAFNYFKNCIDESHVIWNNISKFDYLERSILFAPEDEQTELITQQKNILIKEIEITKPDICIFFIGKGYKYKWILDLIFDDHVESDIDNAKMTMRFFGKESEKYTISKINSKNLPDRSYVTYHPNTINWQGVEIRDNIYELLKELIVK